jgi:hypothetical protein
MTEPLKDTLIEQTFIAIFRSAARGIEDRVNGLGAITTDDDSSIVSYTYASLYGDFRVSGKQLHQVNVQFIGNSDYTREVNAVRIFNIVIPEDADICYYYDTSSSASHSGDPGY